MRYILHFGPETIHIDMEGSFTFADSHTFHGMARAIKENKTRATVMIDITRLSLIDSTGIRLLMLVHDMVKRSHCSLIMKGPQGQVLARLKEAALYNVLTIAA